MKFLLILCLLVASLLCATAKTETEEAEEKPEVTKLELVDLGEGESDVDDEDSEVQKKRDSGYSYRRPNNFAMASRTRLQVGQPGHRGRIVNRHPAQINRPITKYGPPGYQNSSPMRPVSHNQQHRDKLQFHGHFNQQQHSNNFDGRPSGGLLEQEVPSPIRQVDFIEPNPISTQNDEPFSTHSANYLPPQNQKLPGYSAPQTFSPAAQAAQRPEGDNQGQPANFQSQNVALPQGQLSDAALFLAQNAQAIQQLYGAPPNEQNFAPHTDQFLDPNNQVQSPSGQFQNFEAGSRSPPSFPGPPLPSYASGTLSAQETLEQIQSLEKDRLIAQLQRALVTQSQSADAAGRYAQNQQSFVQSQDLLASLGQRMKIHGLNTHAQNTVLLGTGNTAFNQSPFLPGTTISPGFPLNYGLPTTVQPPTTATTATTTTARPPQAAKGDGTSQHGSSVPAPSQSSHGPGVVPVYGGFVPTLIAGGTAFTSSVPTYGPAFFAPGAVASVQPSSFPTHFGLPIPADHGQKPTSETKPSTTPSIPSTNRPAVPSSPPVNTVPFHPVAASLHPVTPLQPVLPPTHVHPVQTPSTTHPTYGLQTAVINPLLYKPIKPVYPFYYYPNVAYQVPKPALPTYPWSYAPTYAQAKPTQIWK